MPGKFSHIRWKNKFGCLVMDTFLSPLVQDFLSPKEKCLIETSWLGLSVPRFLTPCLMFGCHPLCLFPCSADRNYSDDGWIRHQSISREDLIRSHLLLYSFSITVAFYFLLDPWAILSQVLCHLGSIRYSFHLVDWALSQIIYWLISPQALCHHCIAYIVDRTWL